MPPETTEKIMQDVQDKLSWQSGPPAIRPWVTYVLMTLNVAVYLAMGLSGVSWTVPNSGDAIRWGADFGPLTLSGEWWRLLTSTFVHFGIFHIALNMWCLWDLGRSLEPWLGPKAFTLMYFTCGIAASLVSVTWNPWRASAGASGAIFGVAGAFVSYLYLKKAPMDPGTMQKKMKSLGTFILYNLLYGARAGVDNSAHIGGLVTGLIVGAVLPAYAEIAGKSDALETRTGASISGVPIESALAVEGRSASIRLALIAVFSMAALAGLGVHALASNVAATRYGDAVRLLRRGDTTAAAAQLEEAAKADPKLLVTRELLAECRLEEGQPLLAIPPLEEALQLSPKSEWVQTNLALAYLGAGRPLDALAQITKVSANGESRQWWALFIRGMALREIGNYAAAEQSLRGALAINPGFVEAAEALAYVELESGRLADARAEYTEIMRDNPDDMTAKDNGLALQEMSSSQEAISRLPVVKIPYSKLVGKSKAWPLFP